MVFCDQLLSLSIMLSGFICAVAGISTLLLFLENFPVMWIYHILYIHSSTDRLLDCFHFLVIPNNAPITFT